jgi:hypothetical protein
VVADTAVGRGENADPVHYQVLCRPHHRRGDLGSGAGARTAAGQLSFDV